jgi:hypothetical protein
MNDKRDALAQLFRSAGQAHHRAFAAVDGDDPEWPTWYAQYLAAPLAQLLGTPVETPQLGATLRDLDDAMRRAAPSIDWTLYYADSFLAQHARVSP